MKIVKTLIFLVFAIGLTSQLNAQYDYPGANDSDGTSSKNRRDREGEPRIFFGGNLGLSFGSYTYVELAPTIGYKITPRLWAGLGPKYLYVKLKNYYEYDAYGIKTFASFTILKDINETVNIGLGDIFLYAENESLNVDLYNDQSNPPVYKGRGWVNITLLGGGMRFPIGIRGGFSFMLLWDVTQNPYYYYPSPEIRIVFDY